MQRLFTISFVSLLLLCGEANALETKAKNAILVDYDTGQYLIAKEHQQPVPPASMSKLMTIYIIFSKLKDGSLSMEDTFPVSENAWRKGGASSGGSTMFLNINSMVKIEDLLKGIIIQSGNDACIVAAENIAGSEEDFADLMNQTAKKIGLENSNFVNSTGLPHPGHQMSVEDLAKLAKLIVSEFPEYYYMFSEKSFVYNKIVQGNRNPLLYAMPYADGLKTGHTEEAGFCLTASASRGNRRLILVMTGMESNKDRSEESERMMSWGFREFDNYTILRKNAVIAKVPVWGGKKKEIELILADDIIRTIPRSQANKVKMTAIYDKPVAAPIKKGDKLGVVKISIPEENEFEVDLIAADNVEKLGLFGQIGLNIKYLLTGK